LLELFLSEGLLHLGLVDCAEHLHVGVALLKLCASQRLSLELLESDVVVATLADNLDTTLPRWWHAALILRSAGVRLGNVAALELLKGHIVSSTKVVGGRLIVVRLRELLSASLLQDWVSVNLNGLWGGLADSRNQLEDGSSSNQDDE
jgi:hypothetical protein